MELEGKVCMITGATSGIGEVGALELARRGARLVLVARDAARGEATLARLRAAGTGAAHRVHRADLSRISEMKRVAAEKALPFEPLVPNAETIEAMKAARRGDVITAGKPGSLLASLNDADR